MLRHRFAVNCVQAGVSTASLKKLLGHDRLETTEIYLNISPEEALREFWEKVVRWAPDSEQVWLTGRYPESYHRQDGNHRFGAPAVCQYVRSQVAECGRLAVSARTAGLAPAHR